jgi:hypothetical protein
MTFVTVGSIVRDQVGMKNRCNPPAKLRVSLSDLIG